MKHALGLSFSILAFALAGTGLAPASAASTSPVELNSCNLIYSNTNQITSAIVGLSAQFTNSSTKTATVVNIRTDINGQNSIIRDVGSFAPGIEIHHKYRTGGGQFALPSILQQLFGKPSVKCEIASVRFADNSVWPASNAAASPSASNTASAISTLPTTLTLYGVGIANARLVQASGGVATVDLIASTRYDIAMRVTPITAGSCAVTLRDGNGNTATIPVTVNP